jgi:hypothetical protein
MTVWLGLPEREASAASLARLERSLRDLMYNPDRHLDEPLEPEVRKRVEEKRQAIRTEPATRSERVARFHAIRAINAFLQPLVQTRRNELQHRRDEELEGLVWNRLARFREYAFVLHSQSRMRNVMLGMNRLLESN